MIEGRPVLICLCSYEQVLPPEAAAQVVAAVRHAGRDCHVTADLCGLAAAGDPLLAKLSKAEELTVVACHPRAVRWLFAAGGAPLDEQRAKLVNLRTQTPGEALSAVGVEPLPHGPDGRAALEAARREMRGLAADEPDWMPWFPVIDYDLCVGCRKCLSFCLFGTFAMDGDRVVVAEPDHCKIYCPACARVCPQGAIVFPKYKSAPINGGPAEAAERGAEPTRVDLERITRGDIQDALRRRSERARADCPSSCGRCGEKDANP
jgi:Pyruvate/2-oxoacid:ferredoxin oxidoreductase delta subunit